MANGDTEKREFGAPKLDKDLEGQIRQEIDRDFPSLTNSEKESLVRSRLKIEDPLGVRPKLTRVDIGEGASRKIKDDLFE